MIFADGFSFPPLSADRRLLLTQRTPNFYSRLFTSSLASQCAETSLSRLRLCLTFTGGECQRCRWRHATPISSRAEAMGKLGFCWIFGYLHRGSRELIGGWVKDGLIWFTDEGVLTFHLSLDNVKSLECLWNAFSLSGPFLYKKKHHFDLKYNDSVCKVRVSANLECLVWEGHPEQRPSGVPEQGKADPTQIS